MYSVYRGAITQPFGIPNVLEQNLACQLGPPADSLAFPPSISWHQPPFAISGSVAPRGRGVRRGCVPLWVKAAPSFDETSYDLCLLKRSKNGAVCGRVEDRRSRTCEVLGDTFPLKE